MRKLFALLALIGLFSMYSCNNDEPSYDELKKELTELKALLDQNISIDEVSFEGGDIILKFANGQTLRSTAPSSIIPQIGEDGYWYVNGKSLGVKATPDAPEMPTIGEDGYWYIGDTKTDVKAQGEKGDTGNDGQDGVNGQDGADGKDGQDGANGQDGADGNGIASVTYDDTTGILSITLTDGTKKEFLLFPEAQQLKARKLGDLNGKYLLSSIWGGDMKFMEFEYDGQNRIIAANTFKTVFGKSEKYYGLSRSFNESGKVSKMSLNEYAAIDETILFRDYIKPIKPTYVSSDNTSVCYLDTEDENFAYVFVNKSGDINVYRKVAVYKNSDTKSYNSVLTQEEDNLYYWEDTEDAYIDSVNYINYCTEKYIIIERDIDAPYSETIGDTTYYYNNLYMDNVYNPNSIQPTEGKKFSYLYKKYYNRTFAKGDVKTHMDVNYLYNGDDYMIHADENTDLSISIIMDGNKMDKIYAGNEDPANGAIIKFHYNDKGILSHLSSPANDLDSIARVAYDGQGNPVAIESNVKKLEGKVPESLLSMLGLIYKSDRALKTSLKYAGYSYVYPEGFVPVIKINYDYNMKNFLGHTFSALCPLLEGFSQKHAIEEILWAGHASGMIAEYLKFNEGGYPTKIKGFIQIGASDANLFVNRLPENFPNIGINAALATTYKLEYKKIEESSNIDE